MKYSLTTITGMFLLCGGSFVLAQQPPAQPQPQGPLGGQQGAINAATNTLPQSAGGSNRAPDRFDRTQLDRGLGQLRNTVGGGARGPQPPPATNQPQDFQGGGGGAGGSASGDSQFFDGSGGLGGGFVGGGGYSGMGYGTAAAGQLHGTADLIRGVGEANRNSAAANVLHEKAKEQRIQNWYEGVVTYFKAREANRELRSREQLPISSQEDRIRYSQSRMPDRLSDNELNRDIGDIRWPAVLMAPEFAEHRERLEELFYNRTYYNSGLASSNYVEVKAETERMLATLRDYVQVTEPQAYMYARNFIDGLAFEARFVAGPGGLARS